MILYMNDNCKYVDYNTIKETTGKSRTFLNRFLFNAEVKRTYYRNRLLFNYDDVLKSNEIKRYFH